MLRRAIYLDAHFVPFSFAYAGSIREGPEKINDSLFFYSVIILPALAKASTCAPNAQISSAKSGKEKKSQ